MKTVTLALYKYSELSGKAQKTALSLAKLHGLSRYIYGNYTGNEIYALNQLPEVFTEQGRFIDLSLNFKLRT